LIRHNSYVVVISDQLSDDVVLRELGERIASVRLGLNLSQTDLASQAGISKRTVERLESGQVGTQFSGFLKVCRALGLLDRLEVLLPAPQVSPIDLLRLDGKKRRRASKPLMVREKTWTWDDAK
jgi:transcriptional regulator with XRE-family HTH domain